MLTFISDDVAKHLNTNNVKFTKPKLTVHLANNSRANVKECYQFQMSLGDKTYLIDAIHVTNLSTSVILGIDLLSKLNLIKINLPILNRDAEAEKWEPNLSEICALTPEEEKNLQIFLAEELTKFDEVPGRTNIVQHEIRLKTRHPVKQRYYPRNPAMQEVMKNEVEQMLQEGIIEPSSSPWSSPVVLVKKPSGKVRFCIDFRKVNDLSIKDAYPLPYISGVLDKLREANYISTVDLKNGYWQIPLHEASRPITAFTVPGMGLYHLR